MMPWRRQFPMTSAVVACFNGLRGEAREKAIATGNYDALVKEQLREPGQDEDEFLDVGSQA